jgi:hypothetical protein
MSCGVGVMIIYHPAYDVHHCAYRVLNLLHSTENQAVAKVSLRLMDFYYVYPHLLKKVKRSRPLLKYAKAIDEISESFEVTPNPTSLFYELCRMQDSAFSSLEQKSLISLNQGEIKLNHGKLPDALVKSFLADDFANTDFFKALVNALPAVKLNGKDGFKERSGLMEFRYD